MIFLIMTCGWICRPQNTFYDDDWKKTRFPGIQNHAKLEVMLELFFIDLLYT